MSEYNKVCQSIIKAWDEIVNNGMKGTGDRELRTVFVLSSLITGSEAGFIIPQAGEDVEWIETNKEAFQNLADAGDLDFQGVVKEIEIREDLKFGK